jgi:uncharacterized protein YjbI with pentapeptide repeats
MSKKQNKNIELQTLKQKEITHILTNEKKDFSNKDLSGLSFENLNLQGAKFNNSCINGTIFEGCDLRWSDFSDSFTDVIKSENESIKVLDKNNVTFKNFEEIVASSNVAQVKDSTGNIVNKKTIVEENIEKPIILQEVRGL